MYHRIHSQEDERVIQNAIVYLVNNFTETGHNPKPVIIHTMRVAMYLYFSGAPVDVIVAAILHDLIEDTNISKSDIEKEFGSKIANLVDANSFKSTIQDYVLKYIDTFERNIAAGKEAVLVKAADLLDNADYYSLANIELQEKLYGKFAKFVELSQPLIGDTQLWQDLQARLIELKNELSIA